MSEGEILTDWLNIPHEVTEAHNTITNWIESSGEVVKDKWFFGAISSRGYTEKLEKELTAKSKGFKS